MTPPCTCPESPFTPHHDVILIGNNHHRLHSWASMYKYDIYCPRIIEFTGMFDCPVVVERTQPRTLPWVYATVTHPRDYDDMIAWLKDEGYAGVFVTPARGIAI